MAGWFDSSEAQKFGVTLAAFLIERIPLAAIHESPEFAALRQETVHKMLLQMELFKMQNKLGWFKKAKFANAFKWHLLDAGYESDFVDNITRTLLLRG